MRRALVVVLVLAALTVVGVWFAWSRLIEAGRARLETLLTAGLGSPARIERLEVSLVPLRATVLGVRLGDAAELGSLDTAMVEMDVVDSFLGRRVVFRIDVTRPQIDFTHLPNRNGEESGLPPLLVPFAVDRLRLTDATIGFRMGKDHVEIRVAELEARAENMMGDARLTAAVAATDIVMRNKDARLRINDLRLDGDVDAHGVHLRAGQIAGEGVFASITAAADERLEVSAEIEPRILSVFVKELGLIGGRAVVHGVIHGDLRNPFIDASLQLTQAAIAGHWLGDLSTRVRQAGAVLRFDDFRLVSPAGEARGGVEMVLRHEVPVLAAVDWSGVDLERLLTTIGVSVPFRDRFEATTTLRGQLDPVDLHIRGDGLLSTSAVAADATPARFAVEGRVQAHRVYARLNVSAAARYEAGGEIVVERGRVSGTANVKADDLAGFAALLPLPVPQWELKGRADVTVEFRVDGDKPWIRGSLAGTDLGVLGKPVRRIAGDFVFNAGVLTTDKTIVQTTAGQVDLAGKIALSSEASNDWRATADSLDADLLLQLLLGAGAGQFGMSGGTIEGSTSCRGPWAHAETVTVLALRGLSVGMEPLDRVTLRATTVLPHWTVDADIVHTEAEHLTLRATGEGTASGELSLESTPIEVAPWLSTRRQRATGRVVLRGAVSGPIQEPSGSLEVSVDGLIAAGRRIGDVALHATAARGVWSVAGEAMGGALTLTAGVQRGPAFPYSLTLRLRDSNVAPMLGASESLRVQTAGELVLNGSLRDWDTPTGSLVLSRIVVGQNEVQAETNDPVRIAVDRGRVRIESLTMTAMGSRLQVRGGGTFPGDFDLELDGEGDLVVLEVLGEPFNSVRGQFSIAAQVGAHSGQGWDLRGRALVRDAIFDVNLPVTFTGVNAELALEHSRVRIVRCEGRAGGGEFAVGGLVDLDAGPDLTWSLHEVSMTAPEWLEERVSGKGRVSGTWARMVVSGDIDVIHALYDQPIEIGQLIPWFRRKLAAPPRVGEPSREIVLDLRLRAPDGLFVDNNVVTVEMRANLHVTGAATQPSIQGTIEIIEGRATIDKRVFTVTGGSIQFQNPQRINPLLNISAESRIVTTDAEYVVRVAVSGTADAPRVQFSSDDPSLSQNDILSLVAFGRATTQSQRDSRTVGMGNVLTVLPSQYEKGVLGVLGFDRLEVEPAYVRDTGSIEPRLTIGKDITERFRTQASSSFGAGARTTTQVEYRVTRRMSLVGSWESGTNSQEGAFGGSLRFRYEFRRVPWSLLTGGGAGGAPVDVR